jgi:2-keto-4-pentenoate hydratase/2-oxohepta-3-ene-1,7-dioic acid hydratase in catechol pathway
MSHHSVVAWDLNPTLLRLILNQQKKITMKFATLTNNDLVALKNDNPVPLNKLDFGGTMIDLIRLNRHDFNTLKNKINDAGAESGSVEEQALAAPLQNPPKIVAIGLNYVDHAAESKMEVPEEPLVFTKFPSSIISGTDAIEIPANLTEQVDFEVELGIVIGKKAKNISKEEALSHVFGYTVVNDISARDLQFSDGQWVRGKSLDTFCPLGPVIVTADEIPDPQSLELGCSVNGKTLQEANTKDMVFGVADLVSILSHSFTLMPGDIIASGTPPGVGFSRKPPIFLQPGDTVKSWIEGIGELNNPVTEVK